VLATLLLALLARSARPRRRALELEHLAVLSDLDGVLVDSGAEIERTWRTFAERHGLDAASVLAESHGRRSVVLIRLVAAGLAAGMTVIAVLTTNDESALRAAHRRVRNLRALTALSG